MKSYSASVMALPVNKKRRKENKSAEKRTSIKVLPTHLQFMIRIRSAVLRIRPQTCLDWIFSKGVSFFDIRSNALSASKSSSLAPPAPTEPYISLPPNLLEFTKVFPTQIPLPLDLTPSGFVAGEQDSRLHKKTKNYENSVDIIENHTLRSQMK
jgi:hypothetical protein